MFFFDLIQIMLLLFVLMWETYTFDEFYLILQADQSQPWSFYKKFVKYEHYASQMLDRSNIVNKNIQTTGAIAILQQ